MNEVAASSVSGRWRDGIESVRGLKWGTLDYYVLRRFFYIYVSNLLSFSTIFVLIDAVEHLDEFNREASGPLALLVTCARYYWAMLPVVFVQILGPIVTLASGLFTISLLHRSNELVPILASTRSYPRIFWPLYVAAFGISLATFAVEELWIPRTLATIHDVTRSREGARSLDNQKYWDSRNNLLIVVNQYYPHERRAVGVTVLPIGRSVEPTSREYYIQAEEMAWTTAKLQDRGRWVLKNAVVQAYGVDPRSPVPRLIVKPQENLPGAPGLLYETFRERELETTLIPEDIEVRQNEVVYMRLSDLRRKMDESQGRRWSIKYYSRFIHPLSGIVLLLLGLPAIVHLGGRNIFFGSLVAACIGSSYFVASSFVTDLGVKGYLPSAVGVALGPLFFGAIGLTWLRHLRT